MNRKRVKFSVLIFICQTAFILIFAFCAKYGSNAVQKDADTSISSDKRYFLFQDVNVMIFVGFGFLMTFLKRYGYGAVGLNFLVSVFVIQWATIVRGFLHVDITKGERFEIYINEMMSVDFCAAGVLISFGALIGKISPLQLLVMALIEVVLIQVNEWICIEKFHASDAGESMFIHAFGAYFGLAATRMLYHSDVEISQKKVHLYHADLFSLIGTIFLWMYWPSFNSGALEGPAQHRAVLNTFYSLAACSVMTYALSSLFDKRGRFEMEHIQNATLAGGVAVGTVANLNIEPWGALVIGSVAAILSMVGCHVIQEFIADKLKIHDTCGVNNLHGMPGIMAGIGGIIAAAVATEEKYGDSLFEVYPAMRPPISPNETIPEVQGLGRTAGTQAAFQAYALLLTLGMAIFGGIFTGAILRMDIWDNPRGDSLFDDDDYWIMPETGMPGVQFDSSPSYIKNKEDKDTPM